MGLKAARQRVADITAEIAAAKKARAALGETAVAEKRALTDDERAKFAEAGTKIATLDAQLADAQEILQAAEEANEAERAAGTAAFRQDLRDPDQEAARRAAAAAGIQTGDDRTQLDPKKGFKDHKHFLSEVMDAGRSGRVSQLLKPLQAAQGSDEQGVFSDPHGGFLVPHGVAPGILSVRPEDDPIDGMLTKPPMSAPTVSFNARVDKDHTTSVSGGFTVTRRPETVDGSSSRAKFEQVVLTANEEFGLAFATERILSDSPESFVAIIAAGFNDEYIANAMRERLGGSGNGERQGILNSGCLIAVPKEAGQAADTILTENIDKMVSRSWRYTRATWLANQDTFPQLMGLKRDIGTGGSVVNYLQVGADGRMTLLGRPLVMTEFAKKLGDKGDLILGVWSEYLEGTYQQLRSDESIHVRFAAAERCFRFYRRNDGRAWWTTPLTPAESSATLSPFVVLAAR